MNLQQLEYIIALGEHRHFGHAAEHCNVSQPTLSTMVQKLEEELGAKLFDRSRASVTPTSVGERIIAQASVILRQTSVLSEIISDEKTNLSGSVTISMLPTIAPYLLPRLSEALERELPDLSISFCELKTSTSIESLLSGQVDIAIIASDEGVEGTTMRPVFYEEFLGYVAKTHPLHQEKHVRSSEVDPTQLWLLDEGHCFRDQLLRFCQLRRDAQPKHSYRRGSLETFMHMVERGQGMTFIPELSLDMLNGEHRDLVRPFAIPRPCRLVGLCTRSDYARVALVNKFADLIRSVVPERMHRLQPTQHLA